MRTRMLMWSALFAASGAFAQAPAAPGDVYRAEAMKVAGEDLKSYATISCGLGIERGTQTDVPPTRVFDNLIFLGYNKWNSWALTTSDGIILFDALLNDAEAQHFIIDGLKQIGLDPAQIKYVVVMHGHGDHYGGARLLQEKYGTRVIASETEWGVIATAVTPPEYVSANPRKPERDIAIQDGYTLTLGDTTVRLFVTPGHTPGTISALVPVFDKGQRHLASFWGGTGFPSDDTLMDQYVASVQRFRTIGPAAGVDATISNHTNADMLNALPSLATRQPGSPHPFVMGNAKYTRALEIVEDCSKAKRADNKAKQAKPG